ncbi:MAG: hypothetical protein ACD_38C00119G0004 [uncultured bacterium]|uniref:LytR/CpsA/Psr regulator C-terminal domain-containing protein n=1 Tax=Candidatus Daviesbacteria bacterium GW2011_GWC2_40_12 TaxID=1618431 RepID=A0A0G0QWC3_9BACT|nr:MAG: hypothetical protein ACD_38C00119G0004 [uncultured bacterium]KKQ85538.1 MAG: hypothetical protein UT04_C0002G0010 [Candidatus Daviesbacteria bacterium GW2011_GWF2_38_7]KKR16078.1 MAG: hypothetical protein UT45_C0009G0018 [Candidatus Daviesbacteria bacterium GW2011_GWA2_39_33]KKR25465.1 MAG: hypothetical protein UT54_C0001G0014 [Candidatus Daviesbacteria bacterium GW2011_GWB1_39_5]KKR41646.1 MAG: hypothetical protein UT77_C0008G0018 [Candidatus Daviesbacteria bacterium GW2011_GWC2_40_12]
MPAKSARAKSGRKKYWKDVQSKSKTKKRNKLALAVLGILVGILIIGWLINFTQSLFKPFNNAGSSAGNYQKKYSWDGSFNINLVIRTKNISLLSYNPTKGSIIILNIPDETFLELPNGFGKWQLRAIYDFGQTQGLGGDKLLKESLSSFFAVPIDGFLDLSASGVTSAEVIETLRKNPLSGYGLLSALKTDLTMWELLKFKMNISAVRFDKIKELNLDKLSVLQKDNLPDGSFVFISDPSILDSVLGDLVDPKIVSEHKTIAVLNATDKPQLAQKWARLITNLGGNVIITGNAPERLEKTQVFGEQSFTLKRLRQIFAPDDKISSSEGVMGSSRAQINVLIGEDYIDK